MPYSETKWPNICPTTRKNNIHQDFAEAKQHQDTHVHTDLLSNCLQLVAWNFQLFSLVGGFNHLEKSWSSSMGRMTSHIYIIYPYMKWNIKFMFETTNQWLLTIINHHYPILNQCSKPPTSSLSFKGTSPSRATSAQALPKNACEILLLLRAIGSVLFGEHRHVPTYGVLENLPWYRWPIEIDGLPIKNGDFP